MKMHIPKLGEEIKLLEDWLFNLHAEDRNITLMQIIEGRKIDWWNDFAYKNFEYTYKHANYPKQYILPKDTILIVDRIYIRKGAKDFDSVTFRIKDSPNKDLCGKGQFGKAKIRFWAKLDDVNEMEIELRK